MRGYVARQEPRIDVVTGADADTDDESQRLATEEGRDLLLLRKRRSGGREENEQGERRSFHLPLPFSTLVIAGCSWHARSCRRAFLAGLERKLHGLPAFGREIEGLGQHQP